jgi:hypothetical protein
MKTHRTYVVLLLSIGCVITCGIAHAQEATHSTLQTKPETKPKKLTPEEQAKAARAEKKLHEPFLRRLEEAFLEQLGTPAYIPSDPNAPNPRRSAGTI